MWSHCRDRIQTHAAWLHGPCTSPLCCCSWALPLGSYVFVLNHCTIVHSLAEEKFYRRVACGPVRQISRIFPNGSERSSAILCGGGACTKPQGQERFCLLGERHLKNSECIGWGVVAPDRDSCIGTRRGLHSRLSHLIERICFFSMPLLVLNSCSDHSASPKERDLSSSKVLRLETAPKENVHKWVKQRDL